MRQVMAAALTKIYFGSSLAVEMRNFFAIVDYFDVQKRRIIIARFGLDPNQEPLTLKEVGAELNISKERIRQLEARALTKLRALAKTDPAALEFAF